MTGPASKKIKIETIADFRLNYPKNSQLQLKHFTKYLVDENKPYYKLQKTMDGQKLDSSQSSPYIAYLLGRDLRISDNISLKLANEHANNVGAELIVIYPVCSELAKRHDHISPFRHEYIRNVLQLLQKDLAQKHVPLICLPIAAAKDVVSTLTNFFVHHKVKSVYSSIEYEVDELRFLQKLCGMHGFQMFLQHQSCVVRPGELHTKSNNRQYSVFSPWYRAWAAYINKSNLLIEFNVSKWASSNSEKTIEKFSKDSIDLNKYPFPGSQFDPDQKSFFDKNYRLVTLEYALTDFQKSFKEQISQYKEKRNDLAANDTSHLSHHLAMGVISPRQVINVTLAFLNTKFIKETPSSGADEFIRQVSWRDFYRHVMANWPHICMHRPFQLDYADVQWEKLQSHFDSWCSGHTGFPIVDALMRQLNATGYMNNRSRMIVGSFLSKNLLLDWRLGEQYFGQKLIDCDFASNNCGWGFCSSVGVDPQPYFRIFNPQLQSERFDTSGDFIRRWVPELRKIRKGKQIHLPYSFAESSKIAAANLYPKPIVDYKKTRQRAIERFRDVNK